MANQITTVADANTFVSNLFMEKDACSPVGFKQTEESKLVFNILSSGHYATLAMLAGLEIKICGVKEWTWAGTTIPNCLDIEIILEIEEDWELEHDIYPILEKYGYQQPTDLIRKSA